MSDIQFSIISEAEAKIRPYPYVHVEIDGRYRELNESEKKYLEEKFSPFDGNRPYVKDHFYSKTPDGKLHGFLKRSKLPRGLNVGEVLPRSLGGGSGECS